MAVAAIAAISSLAACGQTPHAVEVVSQTPVAATPLALSQTGNAAVVVDPSSVTVKVDPSGSLIVTVTVSSHLATQRIVVLRASLYDSSHNLIGDATGGSVDVPANGSTSIRLIGPPPNGTVASITFEATAEPTPSG